MKRLISFFASAVLVASLCAPGFAASLRFRGGTVTPEPPTTETCPLGLAYTSFDGCLEANPDAQFRDATLIATYALDSTGNPQTIHHTGPYNKAGINFGVGQTTTTGKEDPRTISVVGAANITVTNVLTWVTITNGGIPKVGMTLWDRPANGTQWYNAATAPKILSCNGVVLPIICSLDRNVTNRSNAYFYASSAPGCIDLIQGGGTNGTSGGNSDRISCDFRNSANGMKASMSNLTFAPINGHNATLLATNGNSVSSGEVELINSYLTVDANTTGNNILTSGVSHANIKLTLRDIECDGGNTGAPILGPYVYDGFFGCFSWDSPGTALSRNQVSIKNVYAHDWAANPFSTQAGYTDTVFQNIVTNRINMNCGDTGTLNGCHGTIIAHGTTLTGSSGSLKVQNITAIYPYGQRNGTITGALSIQGGINSANNMAIEIAGATIIGNTGSTAGHAVLSIIARVARVGAVSSLKMKHLYANSHGTYQCFSIGGDIQNPNNGAASMSANTGLNTSIMTWSGLSGQVPVPYPGQFVVTGNGSSATRFTGTLTDNLNGTSTLDITAGTPGFTMSAKSQIVALRMADPQTHPTLIVSGSGSTYIVSNGSGSGETKAAQSFTLAQVIMPAGSTNPNTGLPTTATFGTTTSTYNGTMLVGGERTQASTNTWDDVGVKLGNISTLDTDVSDLWMMNIAGGAGAITLDGVDLASGSCPGTQPP